MRNDWPFDKTSQFLVPRLDELIRSNEFQQIFQPMPSKLQFLTFLKPQCDLDSNHKPKTYSIICFDIEFADTKNLIIIILITFLSILFMLNYGKCSNLFMK
jgi:hypothetical protein